MWFLPDDSYVVLPGASVEFQELFSLAVVRGRLAAIGACWEWGLHESNTDHAQSHHNNLFPGTSSHGSGFWVLNCSTRIVPIFVSLCELPSVNTLRVVCLFVCQLWPNRGNVFREHVTITEQKEHSCKVWEGNKRNTAGQRRAMF
jgi:hypothetical protein